MDSFSLKHVLNIYPVLNFLEETILFETDMIMPCESALRVEEFQYTSIYLSPKIMNVYEINKFIIVNKSEVYFYWPGKNLKPELIKDLCRKRIKTFIPTQDALFILTNEGKVYMLQYCDNENVSPNYKLYFMQDLWRQNKNIVDIVCTKFDALALNVNGKVYTGMNNNLLGCRSDISNYVWKELNVGINCRNQNIVSIASDSLCIMMVTDLGEVYCLRNQVLDQVVFSSARIVKVVCGCKYTLALSDQGDLYVWGENDYGQLGIGNRTHRLSPFWLTTFEMEKVIDIAAVNTKHLSVAIDEHKRVYVWGLYGKCKILTPLATVHENIYDVFAYEKIMYKPLILSEDKYACHKYANKQLNIMRCLKDAFDDPLTCDFKIHVEGRDIHVHKTILSICSSRFKNMFQHDLTENTDNVLKLDEFSYNVYKAYLKYCYTGIIDIPPEELLDLLQLANLHSETNLKTDCSLLLQEAITISSVILIYKKAIEYEDKSLEERCFSFALKHMTEVIQSDNFMKLDKNMIVDFIRKAARANVFKT